MVTVTNEKANTLSALERREWTPVRSWSFKTGKQALTVESHLLVWLFEQFNAIRVDPKVIPAGAASFEVFRLDRCDIRSVGNRLQRLVTQPPKATPWSRRSRISPKLLATLRDRVERGDRSAMTELAELENLMGRRDTARALDNRARKARVEELRAAAEGGDIHSMLDLAEYLQRLSAVGTDWREAEALRRNRLEEALMWTARAAEAGSVAAHFESAKLALLLDKDDPTAAYAWCEAAFAAESSPRNAYKVGEFAHWRLGDRKVAHKWLMRGYHLATETGDRRTLRDATYQLGWVFAKQEDLDGARTWWLAARDFGHGSAREKLRNIGVIDP